MPNLFTWTPHQWIFSCICNLSEAYSRSATVVREGQRELIAGSSKIAELALKVRPRYHIAATEGLFFARVPYINKDLGAGQLPNELKMTSCVHIGEENQACHDRKQSGH